MMKKIKMFAMAAIFGFVCTAMVGCGVDNKRGLSFESPEDVVQEFTNACSSLNYNKMGDCTRGNALTRVSLIRNKFGSSYSNSEEKTNFMNFFSKVTVISNSTTNTFSGPSGNSCVVKAQVFGSNNQIQFLMKRADATSPWYIEDII